MELIIDPNTPSPQTQSQAHSRAQRTAPVPPKKADIENFAAEVIEASMQGPVLVTFTVAGESGCARLTAALGKLAAQTNGKVTLVDVDAGDPANQALLMQLRIQSAPTVFAFTGGRPVDAFAGVLPEKDLRNFFEKLLGEPLSNPVEDILAQAETALEEGESHLARSLYQEAFDREPGNPACLAGYLRCLVKLGAIAQARELADALDDKTRLDPVVAAALSAVDLAEQMAGAGDASGLDAKLAADETDHQARFDRAMARFADEDRDGAVDDLVEIIRRARDWNDDAARRQLLKFFEAWGPTDPASVSGRRRLSTVLFS